ncbi:hypothetical protein FRB94_005324 [Tulasnella sp. JGI-2019a]|nr:hypothetical protein FRB93_002790 [Tulasnella sp. JGI-2019a]KAG9000578.1 hypothetical protein FRB94_005324 [Tulasnella sp. JGI-2019a]
MPNNTHSFQGSPPDLPALIHNVPRMPEADPYGVNHHLGPVSQSLDPPLQPPSDVPAIPGELQEEKRLYLQGLDQLAKIVPPLVAILLLKSVGIFSTQRLDHVLKEGNEEEWIRFRDAIMGRVNNMNVVGSLIITSAAVFLSTAAPNPTLANWGSHTSFIAFGCTIFMAMLSVLAGCLISYIFTDLRATDLRRDNRRRSFKIAFVVTFLFLHTIFLDAALVSILIAIFGAVWGGSSKIAKAGAILTAVLSFLLIACWAVFGTILFSPEPRPEDRRPLIGEINSRNAMV